MPPPAADSHPVRLTTVLASLLVSEEYICEISDTLLCYLQCGKLPSKFCLFHDLQFTLGFIRCTYTVRGLFGSKFHKCKFVNFSVISYIPHVVWPTPDLPTHGKFWSPLPVAIFTASTCTATRLCWAISCYPFSPCCYCVPARHPRSPVGSRRTYKTCQHVPNHTRAKPVVGDTTGSGQPTQPASRFLIKQPGWQHHDLPPPAPLQVPITRNGPPYKAPWHLAGVAPVSGVTCILRLQPHVMLPVFNSTLHGSPVHITNLLIQNISCFIPCYTSTYLVWVQ